MLAFLLAASGVPKGEDRAQGFMHPRSMPDVDPATGRVFNRWNRLIPPQPDGMGHYLTGGHGLWTSAVDAAAAFCAYRNTKYALDGVWSIKHKDTCAAACNFVNAEGWVLYEEHQLYDQVSNDTNNADVWFNGVTGTSEGMGTSPREDYSDLVHGPNCLIAFHGAAPTEGHNREAVNDEARYESYLGISGLAKRWTEELSILQERMSQLHGDMNGFGRSIPGTLTVTGHGEGGTIASMFAFLANHNSDPMKFNHSVDRVTVYGVPPSANFSMYNDKSKEQGRPKGCFKGNAYYNRLPKNTPYVDSILGLNGHIIDVFSILSGYNVSKEVQTAVREKSIFEDLDNVGVHIKHSINRAQSKHMMIDFMSLDQTGQVSDQAEDPKENLAHLLGPVWSTPCGTVPNCFEEVAKNADLAVRSANESDLNWRALTMGTNWKPRKCLSRRCEKKQARGAHMSDAMNLHAPEVYMFQMCKEDKACKGFMFTGNEAHRDIHDDGDYEEKNADKLEYSGDYQDEQQEEDETLKKGPPA
jgi:hypothetical protein